MAKKTKKKSVKETIPADLRESAHKIWLAGLGALSTAEQEGAKAFKNLVAKGKQYEAKGREAVGDVKGEVEDVVDKARGRAETAVDKVEEQVDGLVASAFERFGVPTREEIATLTLRVEELTRVVEKIDTATAKPAAKPRTTRAKTTAAKTTAAKTTAAKKPAAKTTTAKTTAAKTTASKGTGSAS